MSGKQSFLSRFKRQIGYHFLVWPALVFTIIFSYIPMAGLVIAFKNFKLRSGIWNSEWNGLDNFKNIFSDYYMPQIIVNTVAIGVLSIVISFPVVIGFTLLLNEIRNTAYKRVVQTVSYLPHFISWVIMAVLLTAMFSAKDGVITNLLLNLKLISKPLTLLTSRASYWMMMIISSV